MKYNQILSVPQQETFPTDLPARAIIIITGEMWIHWQLMIKSCYLSCKANVREHYSWQSYSESSELTSLPLGNTQKVKICEQYFE